MVLGLDYFDTISSDPGLYANLARAVLRDGGKVYIITSVGAARANSITKEVMKANVLCTDLHIVVFDNSAEAPALKLAKCKELGVELMIDDRADIVEHLNANGILTLKSPGEVTVI